MSQTEENQEQDKGLDLIIANPDAPGLTAFQRAYPTFQLAYPSGVSDSLPGRVIKGSGRKRPHITRLIVRNPVDTYVDRLVEAGGYLRTAYSAASDGDVVHMYEALHQAEAIDTNITGVHRDDVLIRFQASETGKELEELALNCLETAHGLRNGDALSEYLHLTAAQKCYEVLGKGNIAQFIGFRRDGLKPHLQAELDQLKQQVPGLTQAAEAFLSPDTDAHLRQYDE